MNVPKYLWPNPSGSGWVDAWNGWYPTLEFAVSELQGANLEEPYLNRRDDKTIAVTLHSTDVVTAHEDGTLTLNSGGWRTITTKDRINAWLPRGYILCQHDGGWFIRTPQETYEYEDLMTIPPEEF